MMNSYPPPIPARPIGWVPQGPSPVGHYAGHARAYSTSTPQPYLSWWKPVAGISWQYVLAEPVKVETTTPPTQVWIIDLFDNPASTVAGLHATGAKVVAYFSAGTYEDWRDDADQFPKADLGRDMEDWPGEKWVRTSSPAVRDIMKARMDLAVQKGFDGIDPDNVDGYDNKNGLKLTKADAIDYVRFLSTEAHKRGLACGLKNAGDIVKEVVDYVDYSVQEQCAQYNEESKYLPFIRRGKPVFEVEYPKGEDTDSSKCNNDKDVSAKQLRKYAKSKAMGFSVIIKNIKLDQWIQRV